MHDHRTVYLVIRTYNEDSIQSLLTQECELVEAVAPLGLPVYDLPYAYADLEGMKDLLHSNQLGAVAKRLHDDEVDFTSNTKGISGALQGTACSDHDWWLQTDTDINCKHQPTHLACLKKRYTTGNVVEFRNMMLSHRTHGFICVHGYGGDCALFKACSNGFIVDTEPPLGGRVYVGDNHETVLSDTNSVLIHWDGFSDLEAEQEIPYAAGIKEYFYAIGKHWIHNIYND